MRFPDGRHPVKGPYRSVGFEEAGFVPRVEDEDLAVEDHDMVGGHEAIDCEPDEHLLVPAECTVFVVPGHLGTASGQVERVLVDIDGTLALH
jgi:hypothetical protein